MDKTTILKSYYFFKLFSKPGLDISFSFSLSLSLSFYISFSLSLSFYLSFSRPLIPLLSGSAGTDIFSILTCRCSFKSTLHSLFSFKIYMFRDEKGGGLLHQSPDWRTRNNLMAFYCGYYSNKFLLVRYKLLNSATIFRVLVTSIFLIHLYSTDTCFIIWYLQSHTSEILIISEIFLKFLLKKVICLLLKHTLKPFF